MDILAIGNSFSQDAARYLHAISKSGGEPITVVNLYIGGCSLERHYNNMLSDEKAYALECNGKSANLRVSLGEALSDRRWDIVTLQQVSHHSPKPETYAPYLTELAAYVRKQSPHAKLYIHQTWGYEDKSEKLLATGYDSFKQMQGDIVNAYSKAAADINAAGIIRSGEMFGKLLDAGIPGVHRDTFHASLGLGRYALGLLWYHTLTGNPVADNRFADFDEPISKENIALSKATVDSF